MGPQGPHFKIMVIGSLFLVGPLIAPLGGQVMMIFPAPCTRDVSWLLYLRAISWALETRGWEITLC